MYRYVLIRHLPYDMHVFHNQNWTPAQLEDRVIVCSFGSSGVTRMAKQIPYLQRAADGTLNYAQTSEIVYPGRSVKVRRQLDLHVIEGATQLANFGQELKQRLS
jgi:hypothetical protein